MNQHKSSKKYLSFEPPRIARRPAQKIPSPLQQKSGLVAALDIILNAQDFSILTRKQALEERSVLKYVSTDGAQLTQSEAKKTSITR